MISKRLSSLAIPTFLSLSLLGNVLLIKKVHSAEDRERTSKRLVPGDIVPSLDVKINGVPQILSWKRARLNVFYYFDPRCGWCKRNAAAFLTLAKHLGPDVSFYSYTASLEGLPAFVAQTRHPTEIATDDKEDLRRILRLTGTPQTLVVSSSGRLLKNWEGAYEGAVRSDVQEYFHIQLAPLLSSPEDIVSRDSAVLHLSKEALRQ